MRPKKSKKQAKTALIVDDADFSEEAIACALQTLGVSNIHLAKNGQQVMQILSDVELNPDSLICDVFMPVKNGFELIDCLTEHQFKGQILLSNESHFEILYLTTDLARLRVLISLPPLPSLNNCKH